MQKMQFKIKNTKITISFTFFALIILLVVFNKNEFLYLTCFFAIIHELAHLVALYKFGVVINEFKISLFGANIKTENYKKTSIKNEIIILLAGVTANLFFAVFFSVLNYFIKSEIAQNIFLINLSLFIFNLLPFYNFDGGKIIELLLKTKLNEKTADFLISCISFVVLIPIIFVSINVFLQNHNNFYFLVVSMLMLLTIILKK
jgi:stage IV sporulation protein FB